MFMNHYTTYFAHEVCGIVVHEHVPIVAAKNEVHLLLLRPDLPRQVSEVDGRPGVSLTVLDEEGDGPRSWQPRWAHVHEPLYHILRARAEEVRVRLALRHGCRSVGIQLHVEAADRDTI